jgi:nicotinamidase-related amidase
VQYRFAGDLLVIDVQRGIFEQRTKVYKAEEMLANINLLVEKAHQAGAPVVYIQHSNDKYLKYGSELWQFHPEIQPQEGDLHIHKEHGNAFIATELEEKLDELGVDRIVCCGLVTHGCVQATCQGGIDLDYEVVLAYDAHSNYSQTASKIIAKWQNQLAESGVILKASKKIFF